MEIGTGLPSLSIRWLNPYCACCDACFEHHVCVGTDTHYHASKVRTGARGAKRECGAYLQPLYPKCSVMSLLSRTVVHFGWGEFPSGAALLSDPN